MAAIMSCLTMFLWDRPGSLIYCLRASNFVHDFQPALHKIRPLVNAPVSEPVLAKCACVVPRPGLRAECRPRDQVSLSERWQHFKLISNKIFHKIVLNSQK